MSPLPQLAEPEASRILFAASHQGRPSALDHQSLQIAVAAIADA
jgi:hypothetical protein